MSETSTLSQTWTYPDPQRDENWGQPCRNEVELFNNLDRLGEYMALPPCMVTEMNSRGEFVRQWWTDGTPAWRRLVARIFLAGLQERRGAVNL